MGEAGPIAADGDPLEDLALSENERNCAEDALQRLVEPVGRLSQQDEAEYPVVEQVTGRPERDQGERVQRGPGRKESEDIFRGYHALAFHSP